jgi:hypothetical protein
MKKLESKHCPLLSHVYHLLICYKPHSIPAKNEAEVQTLKAMVENTVTFFYPDDSTSVVWPPNFWTVCRLSPER